jgi:hypothetical protein
MPFKKKMFRYAWFNLLFLAFVLCSCGKDLPELEGIDLVTWKDDKNACNGKRAGMLVSMEAEKVKLIALSEMDIVTLLGKPDQNELYKRNQKFYTYFIQPSDACNSGKGNHPKRLIIRFNAVGLAKEVSLES